MMVKIRNLIILNCQLSIKIGIVYLNIRYFVEILGGDFMIKVTGLNNKEFVLNAEHIEKVEEVPETLITLTNSRKYIVLQPSDEIVRRVIEYKHKIFSLSL